MAEEVDMDDIADMTEQQDRASNEPSRRLKLHNHGLVSIVS